MDEVTEYDIKPKEEVIPKAYVIPFYRVDYLTYDYSSSTNTIDYTRGKQ